MQILVIILSVFLAVFLVLAIILTIQLLRITSQIKTIANTTQSAVERINSFAGSAAKLISPAFLAQVVMDQVNKYKSKNSKKHKEEE